MSRNLIKLPGLIDAHVHLREPGAVHKEDFSTGTMAAVAGGYTTIIDMPNNPEPTVTPEALNKKIDLAKGRIYCDLGFHFGATAESSQYFDEIKNKVFGYKLYMSHTTGPLLVDRDTDLDLVFSKCPKDRMILIHAEGEPFFKSLELAKKFKQKLHICHVSRKDEILAIRKLKEEGFPITCEVSCHHLFLNVNDVKRLGAFGMMRPPLQSENDVKALWENLEYVDIIASDHAPHTKEEKLGEKIPFGIPGLETTLPLLLTAVNEGKLTIERLVELTSTNPAKLYNIKIEPNTFTMVDLDQEYFIDPKKLYTKCGWTPFENRKMKGKVVEVVLRGKTVFKDGKIFEPAEGKVIFMT